MSLSRILSCNESVIRLNPLLIQKFIPMKQDFKLLDNPPHKVYIKLTILGSVLVGFVYLSLLILNSAVNSAH
jgi:hypothetical protein